MEINIAQMRQDYSAKTLDIQDVATDPFHQFDRWFAEAVAAQILEPNAMTLATATAAGVPSARIVLLKGYNANGFVFYTNYHSRKGEEMAQNAHVALVFFWGELQRQVRIEGTIRKTDRATDEAYFQSRPRGSQVGAWASPQSQVIENRPWLENRLQTFEQQYAERDVLPLPEHWGGYCVQPTYIEFWQGRSSRLHDRIAYQQEAGAWRISRLAP